MEIFLIKSAACLGIFYAFYKLFLERENMHQMKRFYLLGAVLASFLIPLVTFTEYVEIQATTIPVFAEGFALEIPETIEVATNYWPTVLWSIYILGVLFFSLKFGRNLYSIIQKIRKNPLFKNNNIFHVLLKTPTTPHTFFSYIFLNKRKFEADEIPEEVLLHEQAHAREFHSLDVILMELLQIVFWFNPFLYFFKHSIKLNHEFLADRAVLNEGVETASYQNILLAFSSNASAPELANSINYSFIKKRFTVMKTSTSKRATWLKTLLILPLAAVLVYGFSTTQVEQKVTSGPKVVFEDPELQEEYETWYHSTLNEFSNKKATPQQIQQYNKLASFWNKRFEEDSTNRVMPLSELKKLETIYRSMTLDQRNDAQPFPDCGIKQENNNDTIPTARSIDIQIEANGTYLVEGISATKNTLAKIVGRLHQDLTPAIRNHMMNIHITHPKEPSRAEVQFIFDTLNEYGFYRLVAGNQEVVRGKGNTPMKSESIGTLKSKASWEKEYAKEFNEGAKRNGKLSIVITVNVSQIMVNGKVVALNKFASEIDRVTKNWSTTDFNDAHPSVLIAATPTSFLKKLDAEFKKTNYFKNNGRQSIIPTSPPPPSPDAPPAVKVIKGVNDGDANIPPPPPPPPAPEEPLDHVIRMAKKGATFYYEGDKISSDKAIELLKKNEHLNIQTLGHDSKKPVVKISKSPIIIKKAKGVAFESGNTRSIGGEKNLFYVRIGDQVTYYDQHSSTVNIQGEPVPDLNKSPFVYNGQRISPQEANSLLQKNKSLAPAAQKNKDGYYSILLNSHTNNASKSDYNNINKNYNNVNKNNIGNVNPNSGIGITEALKRNAKFYYNDQGISTKEAMNLIQDPMVIARVQTVTPKNGKPSVYLYDNLSSGSSSNLNAKTSGPFRDPIVVFKNIIENGDAFFLKDKKIAKKEALKLYKANPRIQVRSVNNGDGTSNVYLNNDGC